MAKGIYYIVNRLKQMFRKKIEIPSYEVKREVLKAYKDQYSLDVLVETGTFLGDTVDYFKNAFSRIISIELAVDLANKAMKRFEKLPHITIINGDSGKILKDIVRNEPKPALFWLDGHYSSEFFVGDEFIKTAKAEKDTPIEEELRTVLSSSVDHIILIDDARLFNGTGDYPTLTQIKRIIEQSGKKYSVSVSEDIIRVTPSKNAF